MSVRILVVGGGGREHALCWALARSPRVERVYAAPGNPGIASLATLLPVAATDVDGVADAAEREDIDLTVVGPEAPLVAGLADALGARGLRVFGPVAAAARIEGSKAWAHELCDRYGIPSARARAFDRLEPALEHVESLEPPFVVKADGLAAGKGVTVAEDREAARRALRACLVDRVFGDAGSVVVVEEYLEGIEASALALTDGRTVEPLELAQDYKRAFDGDEGPNTGGMGAYSPVPVVDEATRRAILDDVLRRAVAALEREGAGYRGVLYAGLMLTERGPRVLEFNCRFGDPEAQVVLPRMTGDLAGLLLACAEGDLGDRRSGWTPDACVGVVLASGGYPGPVDTGVPITGLEEAAAAEGAIVFHSGTAERDGRVVTAGGRVLTVAATGPTLDEARGRAYEACARISFEGMRHRTDIAAGLEERVA